jgi:hypothetical protein
MCDLLSESTKRIRQVLREHTCRPAKNMRSSIELKAANSPDRSPMTSDESHSIEVEKTIARLLQ